MDEDKLVTRGFLGLIFIVTLICMATLLLVLVTAATFNVYLAWILTEFQFSAEDWPVIKMQSSEVNLSEVATPTLADDLSIQLSSLVVPTATMILLPTEAATKPPIAIQIPTSTEGTLPHTSHTPQPLPVITSTPTLDFIVKQMRLRTNEENGGHSPNGSSATCGFGHQINVLAIDAAGNPLDGVVLGDEHNNPRQITGSKGPGRAAYTLYFNGYRLQVVEYAGLERPVTSETSPLMSAKDEEIPIPWLIEGHYCATAAECLKRVAENGLCRGHYSFDITFQRTW